MANKPPTPAQPPPTSAFVPTAPFNDGEGSSGSGFLPNDGAKSTQRELPTAIEPTPTFQLLFHPNQWVVSNGHILPAFRALRYVPGAGGVDVHTSRDGKQTVRIGMARGEWELKGYTPIPFDAIPDAHSKRLGQDPNSKSYLWRPAGRPDVVLHYCQRVYPGSKQIDCNEPLYVEWCGYLQDRKIIQPAPVYVLRDMLVRERASLAKAADKNRTSSAYADVVKAHETNIAAIEALIAKRQSEQTPSASDGAFTPAEA